MRFIPLTLFGITLTTLNVYSAQPTCGLNELSKNCGVFKEPGNENGIKFSDGTFIPNPIPANPSNSRDSEIASLENKLRAQSQAMRALQSVKSPKISTKFLIAFNNALPSINAEETPGKKGSASAPLMLPWPPADEEAPIRRVSRSEISEFISSLPEDATGEVSSAIRSAKFPPSVGVPATSVVTPEFMRERMVRAKQIYGEIKEIFLDEILQGRAYDGLSEYEKAHYDKIKNVSLTDFEVAKSFPSCNGSRPDAFFKSNQTLVVCPNFLSWPDASLAEIIGHEIGHAIGPCNSQFPVIRINKKAVSAFWEDPRRISTEYSTNNDRMKILGALKNQKDTDLLILLDLMDTDDPGSFEFLRKKGFFEVAANGIPADKNPYNQVYNCLVDKANLRKTSSEELKAMVADYIRTVESRGLLGAKRKDVEKKALARVSRYPQCVGPSGKKGQMEEAVPDAWSAKTLGVWLTRNPPKKESDTLAPMASLMYYYCDRAQRTGSGDIADASIDKPLSIVGIAGESADRVHPFPLTRANKIHLTEARVAAALGCEVDKRQRSCLSRLGTNGKVRETGSTGSSVDNDKRGAVR